MARDENMTLPAPRRARKSLGPEADGHKAKDKENATVDIGAAASAADRKKLRSKSMGPGGMGALKEGSGNRRASVAAPSNPPRSILKPSMMALTEIPPLKKGTASRNPKVPSPVNDSASGSKVALRTEEEQQAAAREREERERRDARRKSLANRRVSFAAEATLHTFHEVEYMQDSTTSTESSRRASSVDSKSPAVADRQGTPYHNRVQDASEHRRSSGVGQSASQSNNNENTAASIIYSSDSEPADVVEEIDENDDEEEVSSSNSDSDDGTMMTVDDVTGTTSASQDESSTLDGVLRLAAHRAGTHNLSEIEQDAETDDDDGEEEVIPSFGWVRKDNPASTAPRQSLSNSLHQAPAQQDDQADMDMDMTSNSVGKILREDDPYNVDEDLSMDVTTAVGGILPQVRSQAHAAAEYDQDEATMDMTAALGVIQQQQPDDGMSEPDDNEDMSMEMTAVMGRVLGQHRRASVANRRKTLDQQSENDGEDTAMDMTMGAGQILSHSNEPPTSLHQDEGHDSDATMDMDMTTAIGGILSKPTRQQSSQGQKVTSHEQDTLASTTSTGSPRGGSWRVANHDQGKSDNDSLGLQGHRSGGVDSPRPVAVRRFISKSRSPSPTKTATPLASSSPMKFSPIKPNTRKAAGLSPVRGVAREVRTPSPARSLQSKAPATQATSARAPPVVLTPQKRRLSGQGLDREGLGSPRIAEVMDRRSSIGEAATDFIPGRRMVAFEDPRVLEEEVDKERQAENERESRLRILQKEADTADGEGQDGTHNLREMIDAMSPKRQPLRGRKSLHVGSAQGLLGKRPAELDSDEEDSELNDGVKRLKGHQASPVKNVRLRHPGVQGALGHTNLFSPGKLATPSFSSPVKRAAVTTPQKGTRFRDANKENQTVHEVNFAEPSPKSPERLEAEVDADDDRIHLQDFLNMTSIRFMELNTTKRRHTAAPPSFKNGVADEEDDLSLEKRVLAGACTVPMLELYQHSCRELKKYISEGRRMVKEIEVDTFEENPALFREYLAATPDVKALMDNQFKNVKSHARLLSKAMWYEWRMKLQDGLKEGLIRISKDMDADEKVLSKQQSLISSVLPGIVEKHDKLFEEKENLEEAEKEMASCDPTELQAARDELADVDEDVAEKKRQIAELRQHLEASEVEAQELAARKETCIADIRESEKTREECRGWTSTEVNDVKSRVDTIENQHGWAVTGISNTILSLSYRREVELVFDVASFEPHKPNAQIDLWYIADSRQVNAMPKTPEKEFFLQCIRDSIRALPQSRTKPSLLLNMVKQGWDKARMVSDQIAMINTSYPTVVSKTSDTSIAITSSLLLVPLKTRVEVTANLHDKSSPAGVDVAVTHTARVVYGETFKIDKMGEFLSTRIGDKIKHGGETWSDVIVELRDRLIARGRKA